jgi:Big-like domain-containing protein
MRGLVAKIAMGTVLLAGVTAFAASTQAGALFPQNNFNFSPDFGPPGTVISVSGMCNETFEPYGEPPAYTGTGATHVIMGFALATSNIPLVIDSYPVGTDGHSWSGTLTVPNGIAGGQYVLEAQCDRADGSSSGDYPYSEEFFQVQGFGAPTLALSASAPTSQYSEAVSFTATLSGPAGDTQPTGFGDITFDGNQDINPPAGTTGTYTATIPPFLLGVGTHTITWTYPGDNNYSTNTASLTLTVNAAPTSLSFVNPPTSAPYGQNTNFTVSDVYTSRLTNMPLFPADEIQISEGNGTVLGQGMSSATTGQATIAVSGLAPGPYVLTATSDGPDYVPSSATTGFTVNPTTSTIVASSVNPSTPGQSVTFVAQVKAVSPATGTPSGLVQLSIDGSPVGSAVSLIGGVATFPAVTNLTTAQHVISVAYSGSGTTYSPSSGSLVQTVAKAQPVINADPILSTLPNIAAQLSYAGHPLTGQTLNFYTPGGVFICSGVVNAAGTASCAGGTRALESLGYIVQYAGNATYLAAQASGPV